MTEHVFEGEPDDRQAGAIRPSRFRPRYRALSPEEKALHDLIKLKAAELLALYGEVGAAQAGANWRDEPHDVAGLPAQLPSRYLAIATTELESSVMFAVKALTL